MRQHVYSFLIAALVALPAFADTTRSVRGAPARELYDALGRAGVATTQAVGGTQRALPLVHCTERGGGAGHDSAISGPPRYSDDCDSPVAHRAAARALITAFGRAGVFPDCGMGGICGIEARAVSCSQSGGAFQCTLTSD